MDVGEALKQYNLPQMKELKMLSGGNINKTYLVVCKDECFVLQQINHNVFKDIPRLMHNICLVTEHLQKHQTTSLRLILTRDGKEYSKSGNCYFRLYNYIGNSVAFSIVDTPKRFYQAGIGFGAFQCAMADFDAHKLYDVIPNFHNTVKRFAVFKNAVQKDSAGRVHTAQKEIEFLLNQQILCHPIVDGLSDGSLPIRVTHNDTKISNILFDKTDCRPICVIDLDTVMKGSVLFDFGDAVRSGCNKSGELGDNNEKTEFDLQLFKAFTVGFLSQTRAILNRRECELLPISAAVMTYELALRFLEDYLCGDVYFAERFSGINLLRSQVQIRLLKDILDKLNDMECIVQNLI